MFALVSMFLGLEDEIRGSSDSSVYFFFLFLFL